MRNLIIRKKKGVALIITVGVLSLMAILATSFAYNMMFDLKGSANQVFKLKAKNAADAGIALAIAYMRNLAQADFNAIPTASCDWDYTSASSPSFDARDGTANNSTSGSLGNVGRNSIAVYSLKVIDTNSQINVNDTNPNLRDILGNLAEILGLARADGEAIADNANRPFATKEEVMTSTGWTAAKYAVIRDYITVNGYFDDNSEDSTAPVPLGPGSYQRKAPVNINTASSEVLQAVLRGVVTDAQATALAAAVIAQRGTTPFRGWNGVLATGGFDDFIDNVSIMPALGLSDRANIKSNANPNKIKPSTSTTDFCFNPGGYFEITSSGATGIDANSDGDLSDIIDMVSARWETVAVARIYEVLNYTTKEQFRGEDANYNGILDPGEDRNGNSVLDLPVFSRVTWLNSCPVLSNEDQGLAYAANYSTIPNSLKLGFWDNFDEDNDNVNSNGYSWLNWHVLEGSCSISDENSDGDNELWGIGPYKFALEDPIKWLVDDNFSLRISLIPGCTDIRGGINTGHIQFQRNASDIRGKLWVQRWGFFTNGAIRYDLTIPPSTVADDPDGTPREGKDFLDSRIVLQMWQNIPLKHERTYPLGNTFYGLSDYQTDHYNNWSGDEHHDEYHGASPLIETIKLVVADSQTPNYRVYLAVGTAQHDYWHYNNGWWWWEPPGGTQYYTPVTTNYVLIPFHAETPSLDYLKFDRYGKYGTINTDLNRWQATQWFPVLYGNWNARPKWDDVRIITDTGYYQSSTINPKSEISGLIPNVRWGTMSWTLTIPVTADPSKETCTVQANTGSGLSDVSLNGSIGGVSNNMVFRINLLSTDIDYSETPVLEDITFTYLPTTNVFYYKAN